MTEREYIVTLHKGVDSKKIHNEIISDFGGESIPQRPVETAKLRSASTRNTHYYLNDSEAESLRKDIRVLAVEIPPEKRNDIQLGFNAVQEGNFSKTTSNSGEFINWGLRRINESTNPYVGNSASGGFNYTLDGKKVDIVIQDSGIQADHPEFLDSSGISRVQQIDWYAESGITGTMPAEFYTDYDGHGTHCAGITSGLTYGWAKNSNIYSMKLDGLQGPSDPNGGIPISDTFDVIKEWHNNKPIDPEIGYKRPTIVNMSWGYRTFYTGISSMTYRGVEYTGTDIDTEVKRWNFGLVPLESNFQFISNVRIASVDADIDELIAAGVHVVIAGGNNYSKIDVEGGTDFDNTYTKSSDSSVVFYHRGSSPASPESINVGNVDSEVIDQNTEQSAESSEKGPGIDLYAPGTDIMSCVSNTNVYSGSEYPSNTNYRIANISGTSFAAPQIAGVLALFLQLNPQATPAQAKEWLISASKTGRLFETGQDNDYTNLRSLMGGNNRFGFNPFNSAFSLSIN